MPLQTNCFSLPYGHCIPHMLAKERAWMHQNIHPVPGAPGSTPRSCNLDKATKFLCSQAWIKACGATDYRNPTQCKTFPMPEVLQSEGERPNQAYTAGLRSTGQKAAEQKLNYSDPVTNERLKQQFKGRCCRGPVWVSLLWVSLCHFEKCPLCLPEKTKMVCTKIQPPFPT